MNRNQRFKCTVVMYHYVREIKNSKYPNIKGLEFDEFKDQLSYFNKNYKVITMEDFIESVECKYSLPDNALLLTFDDGYIDHYEYALPILKKMGFKGSFFPCVKTSLYKEVFDVNKIHFILEKSENKKDILIKEIFKFIDEKRDEFNLLPNEIYYKKLAVANRFDDKDTIFIKRILQRDLPEKLRNTMCKKLFESYVGMSEEDFSKTLYMNMEQLKEMSREGMHIGSHGYNHLWLNTLDYEQQAKEIERSLEFLGNIRGDMSYWTMCYPYGAFNDDTKKILEKEKCKLAFTTEVGFADNSCNKYEIPRFDTNDFYPKKTLK